VEEFVLRTVMSADDLKGAVKVDFSSLTAAKIPMPRAVDSIMEAIQTSPGADLPTAVGTLWGAFNGVTYYADHVYGRSQDTRLAAAFFGPGDTLKQRALNVARDMAAIRVR
jgi:hypothetical protein